MKLTGVLSRRVALTICESPSDSLSPLVRVEDGCRVVCASEIKRGTTIYVGAPILVYNMLTDTDEGVIHSLSTQSDDKIDYLMRVLGDHYPRSPLLLHSLSILNKKIKSNSFGHCGKMYLYGLCSKFNHSCDPNCFISVATGSSQSRIITLENVSPGEECRICYTPLVVGQKDVSSRRRILSAFCGFVCSCDSCASGREIPDFVASQKKYLATGRIGHCYGCQTPSVVNRCSRCKKATYCDEVCQRRDWPRHKAICS